MPDAIITSTASTFGTISGTFAADQSTIVGTVAGSVVGTLTGSVGVPGPQGPTGPQGPIGPEGPPGEGGTWGSIVGTLSDQTDLQTALNGKYSTSNPAGYITSAALTGLASESWVTASFYPLTGNPSGFITSSALTGYATQSFVAANYAPIAAGLPTGGTVGQVLTKNSGTDYDDSWQTLIPGDRYLTTSTTSNSVSNGTKTFTVGTGLSYSSQQDVVISYDASNHMHALVTSYNSGTGVLVVDVNHHTGSGTYAAWTINVGGMVPLQSVEWGEILGTLGDQTDLATALNAKLETSTAASTYAALAGATFTGEVITPASTTSNAGLTITPGVAPTSPTNGEIWATTNDLQVRLNGVTETVAEQSWVTAGFYPLSGNPSSFLVAADITGKANLSGATFTGLVGTVASTTTTAGLRIPHGSAPTTPVNGDIWTTTSGLFHRQNGSTQQYVDFGGTQTISGAKTFSNANQTLGNSTAAGTINIGTGATISGATKTINIGTSGVLGSTNIINIGPTATSGSINFNNNSVALGSNSTATTAAADTNSTALATTAFVVGQAGSATPLVNGTAAVGTSLRYARQDHVHGTDTTRAPLASPTFTGTVTIPAGASISGFAPLASPTFTGTVTIPAGASISGFAPLASPTFTGTPSLPTGTTAVTQTAGNNTTAVATTAFVTAAVPAAATHIQSLQFSSTSAFTRVIDASSQLIAPSVIRIWPSPSNYNGTSTSGAGASAALSLVGYTLTSPSAGVAGSARAFHSSTAAELGNFMYGGTNNGQINFSRRVSMAFRFSQFPSSTSSVTRVLLGKIHGTAVGDLTSRGIGVKYVPNGANFDFQLQVHNGTTLTSVTSSTQYAGGVADLEVVSDGAGNAVLYLNGNQVASTTGAPTGNTSSNPTVFAEIESQATTANQPVANIGRLYINTLNF